MRAALLALVALGAVAWGFDRLALWARRRQALRAVTAILQEVPA